MIAIKTARSFLFNKSTLIFGSIFAVLISIIPSNLVSADPAPFYNSDCGFSSTLLSNWQTLKNNNPDDTMILAKWSNGHTRIWQRPTGLFMNYVGTNTRIDMTGSTLMYDFTGDTIQNPSYPWSNYYLNEDEVVCVKDVQIGSQDTPSSFYHFQYYDPARYSIQPVLNTEYNYTPPRYDYFSNSPVVYATTNGYTVKFGAGIQHDLGINGDKIQWRFDDYPDPLAFSTICNDSNIDIISYTDSCGVSQEVEEDDTYWTYQEFYRYYDSTTPINQGATVTFIDENDREISLNIDFKLGTSTITSNDTTPDNPEDVIESKPSCGSFDILCIIGTAWNDFIGVSWQDLDGSPFLEFNTNNFGLLEILVAPLETIQTITTSNCQSASLPLPFTTGTIELPCMTVVYEEMIGTEFFNFYQIITNGIVSVLVITGLWGVVRHALDPKGRIEESIGML